MSSKRGLPLRLVRFKNFMATLLRNKMAFGGFVFLMFFITIALAAPLITPYTPQGTVVSAPLNPPSWVTYFAGGTGWSGNAEFTGIKAQTIGTVTITSSSTNREAIDVNVNSNPSGGGVQVVESLSWTYSGRGKRFNADVKVVVSNLGSAGSSIDARIYVERYVGGVLEKRWEFWNQTISVSGTYAPPYSLASIDRTLNQRLGFSGNLNAAEVIFSKKGEYVYGLEMTLPSGVSSASVSVQHFNFVVYGNSWGLLGTDDGGFDILTQLLHGARLSLLVGLVATFIGVGVGLIVGLIAGYMGKVVDEVLMRFTDMMLVIPGLPLLIVLVAVLGSSLLNIILVLGFLGWMGFARVVRSQVLSLRERPFIEAAKASGAGTGYITVRHILPNVVSLTYVSLALSVPSAIVGEAALSFLGLGDISVITWGRMLQLAREAGGSASNLFWWWVIPPGIGIAALSLSFILLGYALDEMFNPRLRRRR